MKSDSLQKLTLRTDCSEAGTNKFDIRVKIRVLNLLFPQHAPALSSVFFFQCLSDPFIKIIHAKNIAR